MNLKKRVERAEVNYANQIGEIVCSIIICSLPPKLREDGTVIPRKPGDTEGKTPRCAYITKGPSAGQQMNALDGETVAEFQARVERILDGMD